ncbi:MAG: nucleotidyltransferase domain-containing protein [Actinobacteria bacterium]|nr:nucleotidyltransferase domain-containing protein [Actinomycetota bacterium]MBU1945063.1 nucleotidyltransferase domain-containing protein [Actinomycetota bacterium]MBU2686601.1 nucleotidyltransferase domain-containing protein [Actinomycetota bacterium]
MRFHEPLNDILGNKVQLKLLRVLVRSKASFTGRELARLIGHSQNQTSIALRELERSGLVTWQSAGRSNLYSIDRDNILVTELLETGFRLEDGLLDRLADIYFDEVGRDLQSVVLFGSMAGGDEQPNSDVDLIIVARDRADLTVVEDRVAEASLKVTRRFGNQATPFVVTRTDYDRKMKSKRGFWREVAETGIVIFPRAEGKQ